MLSQQGLEVLHLLVLAHLYMLSNMFHLPLELAATQPCCVAMTTGTQPCCVLNSEQFELSLDSYLGELLSNMNELVNLQDLARNHNGNGSSRKGGHSIILVHLQMHGSYFRTLKNGHQWSLQVWKTPS